jgi:methylglyoxal synthase
MTERKAIALIAHDQKKDDLADFARSHRKAMSAYPIVATGTTGGASQRPVRNLMSRGSRAGHLAATSRSAP